MPSLTGEVKGLEELLQLQELHRVSMPSLTDDVRSLEELSQLRLRRVSAQIAAHKKLSHTAYKAHV